MISSNVVKLSLKDQVATVMINRPEALNALNAEVLQGLAEALAKLRSLTYDECRVVTICGAGEKAFVAGADIRTMLNASKDELTAFIELGQRNMRQIELLPMPVIAVIDGYAVGGGLEIALACDLIVADTTAKLGQAEVSLGLIPGFGGTQRLAYRVGCGTAKRLIYTGENITAEQSYRIGLVDWVAEPEKLSNLVEDIARTLAAKGPLALAAAKRAIQIGFESTKLYGLTREVEEFLELFSHEDTREGLRAFVEKRKPNFLGK